MFRNKGICYRWAINFIIYSLCFNYVFLPANHIWPSFVELAAAAAPAVPFKTNYYRARVGDNLAKLSAFYKISLKGIAYLNKDLALKISDKDDANKPLTKGQMLLLPAKALSPAEQQQFAQLLAAPLNGDIVASDKEQQASKQEDKPGWLRRLAGFFIGSQKVQNASDKSSALKEEGARSLNGALDDAIDNSLMPFMNQYGTASMAFELGHDFKFKDVRFTGLLPLYDKGQNLFFTQGALRHNDGRMQFNLGFGERYFWTQAMLGFNGFFDYDGRNNHARFGLGAEYWRNYLRFNINSYLGLTSLREVYCDKLPDYLARPAHGFDIKATSYLPFYPQLGFNLGFEKYFGENIDLFANKNFSNDPSAYNIGINYTPFPLLTIGFDYKYGAAKQSLGKLQLAMTYRLGVPLGVQIDHHNVAALRNLAGSRYDFVARNNNIILSYKKDHINFAAQNEVKGYSGENVALFKNVDISSRWQIKNWDNPSQLPLNASCQNINNLASCELCLPPYKKGGSLANSYDLALIIAQKNTCQEKTIPFHITVLRQKENIAIIEHINGHEKSEQKLFSQVLLPEKWENKGWQFSSGFTEKGGKLSKECYSTDKLEQCKVILPKRDPNKKDNVYEAKFTLYDHIEEQKHFYYSIINVDALPESKKLAQFSVDKTELSYQEAANIKLILKDEKDNPIDIDEKDISHYINFEAQEEFDSYWTAQGGELENAHIGPIHKIAKGVYGAQLFSGQREETVFLTAYYYGHASQKITIHIFDDKICPAKLSFTIDKNELVAGGEALLSLNLRNHYGRPLPGIASRLSFAIEQISGPNSDNANSASNYHLSKIVDLGNGDYQAHFSSRYEGQFKITPRFVLDPQKFEEWQSLSDYSKIVTFHPREFSLAKSSLSADDKELAPRGQHGKKEQTMLRFIARNKAGEAMASLEQHLKFAVAFGDKDLEFLDVTADGKGGYFAPFSVKLADKYRPEGKYVFYIAYDKDILRALSAQILVDPDLSIADSEKSELTISRHVLMLKNLQGYGADVKIIARDKKGNLFDKKRLRLILRDEKGAEVANAAEFIAKDNNEAGRLDYQLYALALGKYQLILQYNMEQEASGQKAQYKDLKKEELYFIDALPSSLSQFSAEPKMLAINNSANYPDKSVISFKAYDKYGHLLDYSQLSSDSSLGQKLAINLFKEGGAPRANSQTIKLADQGAGLFTAHLAANFVTSLSPMGDSYHIEPLFNGQLVAVKALTILISPNMAFPQKAVVNPEKSEIIFNRGDRQVAMAFKYYTQEGYLQGDISSRLSYHVFRGDQDLGHKDLTIAAQANDKHEYLVSFAPKSEGDYTIRPYYQLFGLIGTQEEVPVLAHIHVVKGTKDYDIDPHKSQLKSERDYIATYDKFGEMDKSELCLYVRNRDDKPSTGLIKQLSLTIYDEQNNLIEQIPFDKEEPAGVYRTYFKVFNHGKLKPAGTYKIKLNYDNSPVDNIESTIKVDPYYSRPDANGKSEFLLSNKHTILYEQGGQEILAIIQLRDIYGNLITEREGKTYYPYHLVLLDKNGNSYEKGEIATIIKKQVFAPHDTALYAIRAHKPGEYELALYGDTASIAQKASANNDQRLIAKVKISFGAAKIGAKSYAKIDDDAIYTANNQGYHPSSTKVHLYVRDDVGNEVISNAMIKDLSLIAFKDGVKLDDALNESFEVKWDKDTNHFYVVIDGSLGQKANQMGRYVLQWYFKNKPLEQASCEITIKAVPNLVPNPHATKLKITKMADGKYHIGFRPLTWQDEPMYNIHYFVEIYSTQDKESGDRYLEEGRKYIKLDIDKNTDSYGFTFDPSIHTDNGYYIVRINYRTTTNYVYELKGLLFHNKDYVHSLPWPDQNQESDDPEVN